VKPKGNFVESVSKQFEKTYFVTPYSWRGDSPANAWHPGHELRMHPRCRRQCHKVCRRVESLPSWWPLATSAIGPTSVGQTAIVIPSSSCVSAHSGAHHTSGNHHQQKPMLIIIVCYTNNINNNKICAMLTGQRIPKQKQKFIICPKHE